MTKSDVPYYVHLNRVKASNRPKWYTRIDWPTVGCWVTILCCTSAFWLWVWL